ncbi:MAG: site-2 protease family protein [Okeania sp. SIO2F4]|uniref:site-2 protease family protein n=1 Tax=Okeania sp. SIO2F4 TaxID=2607790 RepID=UPI00142C36BC|nr:site-2 protease family protein [Okeania sp. SIO2F4]NES04498.1 site-2 protease family protein [Okeania sp. SIO2F4]
MQAGWKIGSLFGIPLFLDYSWLIILFWVTYINTQDYQERGLFLAWGAGLVIAILLFCSVVLHELGHSLVAISQGIKVDSIRLFLFSGVPSIERDSRTPGEAFQVAIAGPLVSLVLFFLLGLISLLFPASSLVGELMSRVAEINLILAIFNIIPGLPLDGGQVLKAAVWKITGSRFTGVRWATKSGKSLGWLGISLGLIIVLTIRDYGGFWIALIGWFALRNARIYQRITDLQSALINIRATEVMTQDFRVVDANLTLSQFADKYLLKSSKFSTYFAAYRGRYLGLVYDDAIRYIEKSYRDTQTLRMIICPLNQMVTVSEKVSLLEVINRMEFHQQRQITVLSPAGAVVGIIDKSDIVRGIAKYLKLNISEAEIKRVKTEGNYPSGMKLEAIAKVTNFKGSRE